MLSSATTPTPTQTAPSPGHDRLRKILFHANELSESRFRKRDEDRAAYWTPARRRQKSLQIQTVKPWLCATGPKTAAGKARSTANANKGRGRDLASRRMRRALRLQSLFLRRVGQLNTCRRRGIMIPQTILQRCRAEGRWATLELLRALDFCLRGPPVTMRNNQ